PGLPRPGDARYRAPARDNGELCYDHGPGVSAPPRDMAGLCPADAMGSGDHRDRAAADGVLPALARHGQISISAKKKAISVRAFSGESEPCTELASIDSAKSRRIVPGAAFLGSVAPMISRFTATAFSPSSTWTTAGPEIMKATRS